MKRINNISWESSPPSESNTKKIVNKVITSILKIPEKNEKAEMRTNFWFNEAKKVKFLTNIFDLNNTKTHSIENNSCSKHILHIPRSASSTQQLENGLDTTHQSFSGRSISESVSSTLQMKNCFDTTHQSFSGRNISESTDITDKIQMQEETDYDLFDINSDLFSDDKKEYFKIQIKKIVRTKETVKLFGEKILFVISGDWIDLDFKINMKIIVFECYCCKNIENIKYSKKKINSQTSFSTPNEFSNKEISIKDVQKIVYINNNNYYLIVEDEILSVTKFCLAIKCIYAPIFSYNVSDISFNYSHPAMVIGVILHGTMEECMSKNNFTMKFILDYSRKSIKENVLNIYLCNSDEKKILNEIVKNIKLILKLGNRNLKVIEVEKKLVSLNFFLKGNVDCIIKNDNHIIPVELKTGKYKDLTHRVQAILYHLMMNEKYYKTQNHSFLYYLCDNELKRIEANHEEIKNIIMIRNKVAILNYDKIMDFNLHKEISLENNYLDFENNIFLNKIEMKETANDSKNIDERLISNSPFVIEGIFKADCKCNDTEYCKIVEKFYNKSDLRSQFLQMMWESINQEEVYQKKQLYYETTYISQKNEVVVLKFKENYELNIYKSDFVEISTSFETKLCNGTIIEINDTHLVLRVKENIDLDSYKQLNVSLGKNHFFYKFLRFSLLKYATEIKDILCFNNSIIENMHANEEIKEKFMIPECFKKEFNNLNHQQKMAIHLALNCDNFHLIHGMPGTGKSSIIAMLIEILCHYKKKVLLVCYTNLALQNVILKLKSVSIYRSKKESLNNFKSVNEIKEYFDKINLVASTCYGFTDPIFVERTFDYCIIDEASQQHLLLTLIPIYMSKRFILVGDHLQLTPLIYKSKELGISLFEYFISNGYERIIQKIKSRIEVKNKPKNVSSENSDCSSLENFDFLTSDNSDFQTNTSERKELNKIEFDNGNSSLKNIKKNDFKNNSIVNNHMCVKNSNKIDFNQMEFSNSSKLFSSENNSFDENFQNKNVTELTVQYRMCQNIMKISNSLFYSNKMSMGGKHTGYSKFIDSTNLDSIKYFKSIKNCVVLCYFNTKVHELRKLVDKSVIVETVDRFQGSESPSVIVVFDPIVDCEVMNSRQRLNVALTRAKTELILLGNRLLMEKIPVIKKLLDELQINK
ncbi:hypothetical protein LUQ84_000571 [Hamiltosporidium tvaerminnensis]|nr:hypothetical protein LUQ84_000571 [Hamiltosporidium tvaerminnensis]